MEYIVCFINLYILGKNAKLDLDLLPNLPIAVTQCIR